MKPIKRPRNLHDQYHAHVYYDSETLNFASGLCGQAGALFALKVGTIHQKLVGPHPKWSCQISFSRADFDTFVPWLDANRDGLSVLVHGLSGEHLKDHTDHAYWLGDSHELDLSMFGA